MSEERPRRFARRWPALGLIVIVLVAASLWWTVGRHAAGSPALLPALTLPSALGARVSKNTSTGFARAQGPHRFVFPRDHGPHPRYRTEWWYYTGNVRTADGRRFGYELTFFRVALRSTPTNRRSEWATNQIYMADLALTDVKGRHFYHFQRLSRAALGLAGATPKRRGGRRFRVWLDDWQVAAEPGPPTKACAARGPVDYCMNMRLRAQASRTSAGRTTHITLALTLRADKPLVLEGNHGLSQKGNAPGDASYYYSFTRLGTSGIITLDGHSYRVDGSSWMDREWSSSALAPGQVGWDWFALQLDNGADLMYYRLRRRGGTTDPHSAGSWVAADGAKTPLSDRDVLITPQAYWTSPHTGVRYPARWRLQVPNRGLVLEVRPWLADQELDATTVRYWEGAVRVTGTRVVDGRRRRVHGVGYVELTGYSK